MITCKTLSGSLCRSFMQLWNFRHNACACRLRQSIQYCGGTDLYTRGIFLFAGCLGVFVAGFAVGATVPAAFDPARLAPHIYEVLLENRRVRVLDVTIRNGETPPLHAHPDRLIVYLNSCAWLENGPDGEDTMESYTTGDVVWKNRLQHGGKSSRVIHDCRQLEIELKE